MYVDLLNETVSDGPVVWVPGAEDMTHEEVILKARDIKATENGYKPTHRA